MNRLPDEFIKRGIELAHGATIFNVPFSELSRDELIATAAQGWNAQKVQMNENYARSIRLSDWHESTNKGQAQYIDLMRYAGTYGGYVITSVEDRPHTIWQRLLAAFGIRHHGTNKPGKE